MRLLLRAALAAVLLAPFTAPAVAQSVSQSGPSFDCSKAGNQVERAICADPDLAVLDRELAAVYGAAQAGPDMDQARQSELTARQRTWLGSRNGCAQSAELSACVTASYGQRILELKTYYAGAFGHGGINSYGPVTYDCDPPVYALSVVFINGPVTRWAVVSWEDNAVTLIEALAVDGTRYTPTPWGEPFEFQMWHDDAAFTRPGQPTSACTQTRG